MQKYSRCLSGNVFTIRAGLALVWSTLAAFLTTMGVRSEPLDPAARIVDAVGAAVSHRGATSKGAMPGNTVVRRAAIESDWGQVHLETEGDGKLILENDVLFCQWGKRTFPKGAENFVITDLQLKRNRLNQSSEGQIDGVWMSYGKGRGRLTGGEVVFEGSDRKTVRLTWEQGKVVQEISIFPHSPFVKIVYYAYGVNVVDFAAPGGGKARGTHIILGAEEWQDVRKTITDPALRLHFNPHHRVTDELYPSYPNPIYSKTWEKAKSPLNYNGWLLMGIYDSATGSGFGRLMPHDQIDTVKLLEGGFEFFPCRPRKAYVSYLFVVDSGAEEIVELGKRLVDTLVER